MQSKICNSPSFPSYIFLKFLKAIFTVRIFGYTDGLHHNKPSFYKWQHELPRRSCVCCDWINWWQWVMAEDWWQTDLLQFYKNTIQSTNGKVHFNNRIHVHTLWHFSNKKSGICVKHKIVKYWILLYHYLKYVIVIGPTRVTWYVEIIAVAQCINIPGQHSCSRSTVPGSITGQHYWGTWRYNKADQIYILRCVCCLCKRWRHCRFVIKKV